MIGTLRIAVTLPGNRFHGSEWPSSPSRLFRALLAGAMTGGYRDSWGEVEPALLWLEKQSSPEIEATEATRDGGYRIAIPNNDLDVVAREWAKGKWADASKLRTLKEVAPWKVDGAGPHLVYRWPKVEMDDATVSGLRVAAECLHTLGWGIDAAFASLLFGEEPQNKPEGRVRWRPARTGGTSLATPTEGSLSDAQDAYGRFLKAVTRSDVNPDTRPMVFREERYSCGAEAKESIFFDLEGLDGKRFSYRGNAAMHVAAWMRHAVSQAFLDERFPVEWVNAAALGHGEGVGRFSYVPMPSVGHHSAGGRIQRVMVTRELDGDDDAMAVLEKKLTGKILTDERGDETCRLVTPIDNVTVRQFYVKAAKRWRTVTPIVLHGYNSQRGQISLNKTERLLGQAFTKAGWDLGNIERLAFQPAPFIGGTQAARKVMVPSHLDGWPRYHVAVDFKEAVEGPLLAGLGRHYGIGVFANCSG